MSVAVRRAMRGFPKGAIFVALCLTGLLSCDSPTGSEVQIPASLDVVSGDEQDGVVGEQLPHPIVVRVEDAEGDPIPGQLINFVVTSGGGSVFAGSALTNAQGIAQERWTLGTSTAQLQRLEARAVDSETGQPIVFAVFTAEAQPDDPAALVKIGDVAQAQAGATVTVAVRVADQYGNPIEDAPVTFQVTAGAGSVAPATSASNAEGVATTAWTLGASAGENTLAVSASGVTPVVFTTMGGAGPASRLVMVTQPSAAATAGRAFEVQPVVRLEDALGNPVRQQGVTVSASVASGGGTLEGILSVATNANGVATFTNLSIRGASGSHTLAFSASGVSTVTSGGIAVAAAPGLTIVKHAGDTQIGEAGFALSVRPSVRVVNHTGAPVQGQSVQWAIQSGGGSLDGINAISTGTDANGVATLSMSWILGTTPGTNELMAYVIDVPPVVFTATGTTNVPYQLVKYLGDLATGYTGARARVGVRVFDRRGQPVGTTRVNFEVVSGGGTLDPTFGITDATGSLVFEGWTLGPVPGQNSLRAFATGTDVEIFVVTALPDVQVEIVSPLERAFVGGTFDIVAKVTSRHTVQAVRATVAHKTIDLVFNGSTQRWTGKMVMTDDIPRGEHDLLVTASDVNGTSGEARRRIVHDYPPFVTVTEPVQLDVAAPTIRIRARCEDPEGPCARMTVSAPPRTLLTVPGGEIDAEISLASLAGRHVDLQISGFDAVGQRMDVVRRIIVEGGQGLTEVLATTGQILDANAVYVVHFVPQASLAEGEIRAFDRRTGSDAFLYSGAKPPSFFGPRAASHSVVFPQGTTMQAYRGGQLSSIGPVTGESRIAAEGRYVVWNNGSSIYRYDGETGQTVAVTSGAYHEYGQANFDVGENGDVVYVSGDQIYRYRNGIALRISTITVATHRQPETDGTNVAYLRHSTGSAQVVLHDGLSETVLTEIPADQWHPSFANSRLYAPRAGWAAYAKWTGSTGNDVWVRSPAGEHRRLTGPLRSSVTFADDVGPDGMAIATAATTKYRIPWNAPDDPIVTATHSDTGIRWIEGRLHVFAGRRLFVVAP